MRNDRRSLIEVYGAGTGNCLRVVMTLEEMDIPYAVRRSGIASSQRCQTPGPIGPARHLPTMMDHRPGGGTVVLSQSSAIMLHVAEKTPGRLLPINGADARAMVLERFFLFLMEAIAPSNGGRFLGISGDAWGTALLDQRAMATLAAAEKFLEAGLFMAGNTFSLADIAAFTISFTYEETLDWSALPRLERWYADMLRRRGIERGLRAFQ